MTLLSSTACPHFCPSRLPAAPYSVAARSSLALLACLVFCTPGFTVDFVGGNGSQGNPYQITTVEQLQAIDNHLSSHFILVSDINAQNTATWNSGQGFKPISLGGAGFTGSIDGNGHRISGLTIARPTMVGLIAILGPAEGSGQGGIIKNLHLTDISFQSSANEAWVGGIAAQMRQSTSLIIDCSVSGTINGSEQNEIAGGVVGKQDSGTISQTRTHVTMSALSGLIGGIAGRSSGANSSIDSCRSTGSVSANGVIGGLVGRLTNGARSQNSNSASTVSGNTTTTAGGLVGDMDWTNTEIRNCFASGNVSAGIVGGLVGRSGENIGGFTAVQIWDSFSSGSVYSTTADGAGGGLIGIARQTSLTNILASGAVDGIAGADLNGIAGRWTVVDSEQVSVTNARWVITTTNQANGPIGTGIIASEADLPNLQSSLAAPQRRITIINAGSSSSAQVLETNGIAVMTISIEGTTLQSPFFAVGFSLNGGPLSIH